MIDNEKNSVYIDFDALFGVQNDHAIYPIMLDYIKFTPKTKAEKQEYRIPIEGIYLHYKGIPEQTTNVENIIQQESMQKMLYNGQLIIIKNNKIYNILGHEITEKY